MVALCLLLATLLAGCVPEATAPAATTPLPAVATPPAQPTSTATPQPSPSPTPGLCAATPTPRPAARERPLRFAYIKDGALWLWREETGQATQVPVQGEPNGIAMSGDGQLIAYRVPLSATEWELWVVGADGSGERRLARTSSGEVPRRYPDDPAEPYYDLSFGWVPGTHLLYYDYWCTTCGLGGAPLEARTHIDADSGALRFTLPGGEVDGVCYLPGGHWLAALAATELRLMDTGDGRVVQRYPVQRYRGWGADMRYSPDGRWLVVTTEGAFTVLDTAADTRRDIPIDYEPIGMGGSSLFPPVYWLGDGPIFYTLFTADEDAQHLGERAQVTVARIDAAQGTVEPVHRYTGSAAVAQLSPDRRWLAYRRMTEDGGLELYLVDLASGREACYDSGSQTNFYGWYPDSVHFSYNRGLGNVCDHSLRPAGAEWIDHWIDHWIDGERYLGARYQGQMVTYTLGRLDGGETAIVRLPQAGWRAEPPYGLEGPLTSSSLGE